MKIRFKKEEYLKTIPIEGREGTSEWCRYRPDVEIEIEVLEVTSDKISFRFVGEFLEAHDVPIDSFQITEGALLKPFDGTLDD
jgi:hypothetical protein